ncbi:MAG: DNA polymerase III subunit alpha [Chitinophagales bacterium]|nr:DNA polymerase III subunit alpha [Chitinophagales bacterium]MDW8419617.1 DNA polymerase III subunit alpha [Chitinophagales bacterium]
MPKFSHLHCHTQYSLLDGAADISAMFIKAAADGMPAIAITDHGNMYGVFDFVSRAERYKLPDGTPIKPIVGCEFYLVADRTRTKFTKEDKDKRYHQLLLAKNAAGYKNLIKLCSLGYIEGLYGKYPRIDKELIVKYHENLIATTCCIGAMVPQTILRKGEEEARKEFEWWLNLFGNDYYIELQRHGMPEQELVNEVLVKWSREYGVKIICTNDSHYVEREDANAHDILLCINTGEKQSTPPSREFSDDDAVQKGKRFAFYNNEFYLKSTAEMQQLFADLPEALDNTNEIVDKCEILQLKQDILLPNFSVPPEFQIHTRGEQVNEKKFITAEQLNQWEYLRHLTYQGASRRYKVLTQQIDERLQFELDIIKKTGYAGYFLIVADFVNAGKQMNVVVGPGRGSAAGSAVAYCLGITNIDPIAYNLLFERFLNPDRTSMPDIDTDFDDEGREKVIRYVVDKYSRQQVAQIVTFNTLAARLSIKDVARVLDLPLDESNALAKMVPERNGVTLRRLFHAPLEGEDGLRGKENLTNEELEQVKKLRIIYQENSLQGQVLREAEKLEGGIRGTGIHPAGVIISPKDITEIIPVAVSKETDLYISQFEGNIIESAGVVKMDLLGLRTLTIIRDAIRLIEQNHGIRINPDEIPLDDKKTFELYQRAETNGTFQFESAGMQKYLRELKPDRLEDLIAMNALYRPGPMQYIPRYIARKHGREKITYDLPEMEEYLRDTYGITVYQEQVMLLSQKLAGFTKGDADVLRKAMGKKDKATLDKMKSKFMEGATARGYNRNKLEKIWSDWEAFALYAFNKSHSTCYAFLAFQTAYLKANYPAEYMASVLTHNQGNIEKISFFMEECRRMGIPVKGPDINESDIHFSVNKQGEISYALSAIKGVGESVVECILQERNQRGPFKNIWDFARRVNLRTVNKKAFESLALAGAFDSFNLPRAVFFTPGKKDGLTLIEKATKYGNVVQSAHKQNTMSLFGAAGQSEVDIPEPQIHPCEEWSRLEKLKKEKEVIGIYLSGHPLDEYRLELKHFTTCSVKDLSVQPRDTEIRIAGIITATETRYAKNGNPYARFTLEDYGGSHEFSVFNKDFAKFRELITIPDAMVYITGRYVKRWNNNDEYEFKINTVELLSEMRDKLIKKLTLELRVNEVDEILINELISLAEKYPGKTTLRVLIRDDTTGIYVGLYSTSRKISVSNELFRQIESLQIHFSLN